MLKKLVTSPYINQKNGFILLVAMHLAGAIGLAIPATKAYFQALTPFNLIVTAAIVFHFEERKNKNYLLLLIITYTAGFFIEVVGVKTGVIFGEYSYRQTLGFKVLDVPLSIGLNWALLVYCTGLASDKMPGPKGVRAVIAALMMVGLDLLIEPVAITFDFWAWTGEEVPVRNYLGWFMAGLAFQLFYQYLDFSKNNPLGIRLLYIQALFFAGLNFV